MRIYDISNISVDHFGTDNVEVFVVADGKEVDPFSPEGREAFREDDDGNLISDDRLTHEWICESILACNIEDYYDSNGKWKGPDPWGVALIYNDDPLEVY